MMQSKKILRLKQR